MKTIIKLVVAATAFTTAQALAAQLVIKCPDRIDLEQAANANYASWEVTPDKGKVGFLFESIRLFDGHPREMASLKPDDETEAPNRLVGTWHLPKAESDRGYWVGCSYSNSMTLLAKRLPDTVSICRYTVKRHSSGKLADVESFICE
jgi:hypothetical protein